MTELQTLLAALQGGGQAALLVSVYFMWKLEHRMARIEKALDKYMQEREEKRK